MTKLNYKDTNGYGYGYGYGAKVLVSFHWDCFLRRGRRLELAPKSAGYKLVMEDEVILIEHEYAIEHPDEVARILVNAGTAPTRLAVEQQNLEEHFMQLTGGTK